MTLIARQYQELLLDKLGLAPATLILGARQVGKTTLAFQLAEQYETPTIHLDLELPRDRVKLSDAETFLDHHGDKLVILDEVQAMPHLFDTLRGLIDRDRRMGKYLLLGSAAPQLVSGVSESLAGRINFIDLPPFRLDEVFPKYSQQVHWLRGGFPRAFLADDKKARTDWMSSFVRSYVERDLNVMFGLRFNASLTRRLWTILSYHHGGLLNMQDLSRSLGVTGPAVNRYLDFMEGAFLLHRLRPWFINIGKRLVKAPKVYLVDSGILHFFQHISDYDQLISHPIVGASWEGYVIEQIRHHRPEGLELYFYRTHAGAEIDLLLVRGQVPVAAIEIKYSNSPKISRGFYVACADLEVDRKFIVTPASDTYPTSHDTLVYSLISFLKEGLPHL